jgi:hypothetical protein
MLRVPLVSLGLLLMVGGCSSSSSPKLDTGLPPRQPVGDLSAEQVQRACEGFERLANDLLGPERQDYLRCVGVGIAAETAGVGSCGEARDNCLENGTSEAEPIDLDCDAASPVTIEGCEATIGQLETCANDVAAGTDALLDQVTCRLVDSSALEEIQAQLAETVDPASYASCSELGEACLAFLDLGDEASSEE